MVTFLLYVVVILVAIGLSIRFYEWLRRTRRPETDPFGEDFDWNEWERSFDQWSDEYDAGNTEADFDFPETQVDLPPAVQQYENAKKTRTRVRKTVAKKPARKATKRTAKKTTKKKVTRV